MINGPDLSWATPCRSPAAARDACANIDPGREVVEEPTRSRVVPVALMSGVADVRGVHQVVSGFTPSPGRCERSRRSTITALATSRRICSSLFLGARRERQLPASRLVVPRSRRRYRGSGALSTLALPRPGDGMPHLNVPAGGPPPAADRRDGPRTSSLPRVATQQLPAGPPSAGSSCGRLFNTGVDRRAPAEYGDTVPLTCTRGEEIARESEPWNPIAGSTRTATRLHAERKVRQCVSTQYTVGVGQRPQRFWSSPPCRWPVWSRLVVAPTRRQTAGVRR
jgi:hypothetical protein